MSTEQPIPAVAAAPTEQPVQGVKVRAVRCFDNRSLNRIVRPGDIFEAETGYAKDLERRGLVSTDLTPDPAAPQRTQAVPGAPRSAVGNGPPPGTITGGSMQRSPSSAAGQAAQPKTASTPGQPPKRL